MFFSFDPVRRRRGFTLIEIMITTAIAVGVGLGAFLTLTNYRDNKVLNTTVNTIVAALRDTQNRSITQAEGLIWGVQFLHSLTELDSDYYYQVIKTTSSTGAIDRTITLPRTVFITDLIPPDPGCMSCPQIAQKSVTFQLLSGYPDAYFSITVASIRDPSRQKRIDISTLGLITVSDASGLSINSITPNTGVNTGSVSITTITGTNFQTGVSVLLRRLGQLDIAGVGFVVSNPTTISGGSFDITNATSGIWDVVVTNPDITTASLPGGFTVTSLPPLVSSISPSSGMTGSVVSGVSVGGSRFQNGAVVKLSTTTALDINGSGFTFISSTSLTGGSLNLSGAVEGLWDVRVTNPDGQSGFKYGGFTVTPPAVPQTIIGAGVEPANQTIAPGAGGTQLDAFTLRTTSGTDTITYVTTTVSAGSSGGLLFVKVTDNGCASTYGLTSNPASDTIGIPLTPPPTLMVTTTTTQYKVCIHPKSHAAMPPPPGSTYAVTGLITSFTSGNPVSGSDTGSATVTIDNQSPENVSNANGSAGDTQAILTWTNPPDVDFSNVVVLRNTVSITDTPAEGSSPIVGSFVGSSTVRYVSSSISFVDSGLTNGVSYYYKIFAKDIYGNYSAGGVSVGPFTPQVIAGPFSTSTFLDGVSVPIGTTETTLGTVAPTLVSGDHLIIAVVHLNFLDYLPSSPWAVPPQGIKLKKGAVMLASNEQPIDIGASNNGQGKTSMTVMLVARDAGAAANPTYSVTGYGESGISSSLYGEVKIMVLNNVPNSSFVDSGGADVYGSEVSLGTSTMAVGGDNIVVAAVELYNGGATATKRVLPGALKIMRGATVVATNENEIDLEKTRLSGNDEAQLNFQNVFLIGRDAGAPPNSVYDVRITSNGTGGDPLLADMKMGIINGWQSVAIDGVNVDLGSVSDEKDIVSSTASFGDSGTNLVIGAIETKHTDNFWSPAVISTNEERLKQGGTLRSGNELSIDMTRHSSAVADFRSHGLMWKHDNASPTENYALSSFGNLQGFGRGGTFAEGKIIVLRKPGSIAFNGYATSSVKTNGTSTTLVVPAPGFPTGTSVIVSVANTGLLNFITSISDSAGNAYQHHYTKTIGVAGDGYVSVWSSHNINALSSGSNIIVTWDGGLQARAAIAVNFKNLALSSTTDQVAHGYGDGVTAVTSSTLPTAYPDELLIGSIGVNGPLGDTFTPGASYALLGRSGTTGGSTNSNISVNLEYRIVSSTGSYGAGATLGTSRPWGAIIVTYH
ncbi:prepilin-type N-terminal cleavage/methylation domain-containing protein [Candidatus Jorgensenbacteria bacterium]|nr:prepilin-type N-terminal cleavage/methylation domain-containing protein [Candidatus Jorgensenbacteria bacterium]